MQLTKLGPYEILKTLGKGGMGSVYEAIDIQTGQRVAVKALSPQLAVAEGFRERFEAEIESLKTLRNDGIVRLYGYGEQDGVLFYSMELVDGTSLEDEIKAGRRFQWREVTDIAIQLCFALKHAHDHGVVHRDIKPANILIGPDDRVKLADFGIARLFGSTQLTTAGGVLGTADYMAPEQADGRPVTARCDQYSLGGVMYALLAGRPPFRAKTLPEMLQFQRFAQPEPVRRYADQTPEQLERVIMQLLSKDPDDRFPNTQVLARHLQAMVKGLSRPTADGFTLAGDEADDHITGSPLGDALSLAATQADPSAEPSSTPPPDVDGSDDPSHNGWSHDDATLPEDESGAPSGKPAKPPTPARATAVPLIQPPTATRFTTLEEEQSRHREQQHRSWALLAVQLIGLVAALAGLISLAIHLSRPPSADELYATITSHAAEDDTTSIREVQREVGDFLQRFPDDPRAAELQRYEQQIVLDRAERRLQNLARRNGWADPSLLEFEVLYLKAASVAQQSPTEAISLLNSLIELYGADAAETIVDDDSPAARQAASVQFARRLLERLRDTQAEQSARQVASLRERLTTAEDLSVTDPQGAAAMYRAIIDLYENDAWAAEIVADARRHIETRQGDKETRGQGDEKTD
jgi:serine/threonine-protein kinase